MKREDITVEGIPDGYEVREVDLTPSGKPVCVLTHSTDYRAEAFLLIEEASVSIPESAVLRVESTERVFPPLARCMGEDRLLLHGSSWEDGETDAWVLNTAGQVEQSFQIGGPSEVLANESRIVTHYGDQAMTSDYHPVDREGLAVFDGTGTFLWGFESHFAGSPRLDVFFHTASWIDHSRVAVYRDIDQRFTTDEAFISVDLGVEI